MQNSAYFSDPKLIAYREAKGPVPPRYWLWPLYGAGLENLGVNDRPILVDTPPCGPDQLLVQPDAVALYFSDTKVIQAGGTHPRLTGRDLKANPVVLGHEVALTVVQVGRNLTNRFKVGERYIVQADIYYKGANLAYGYLLQGGLSQYNLIGEEILQGDEGCYLLPVKPETGYAQAALTEPWACVTASYDVVYRAGWKAGGSVLIAAGPGALDSYALGAPYVGDQPPARVMTMGVGGPLLEELRQRAQADGFALAELPIPGPESVSQAQAAAGKAGFDDIVYLGADAALYELLEPLAARGCVLNLVGEQAFDRPAQVDVGRLHYDHLSLTGTTEPVIAAAYVPIRTQLRPGGKAAFLGAAGPMGQMHVQRALQSREGPRLIVATDLFPDRLAVIGEKFGQLIEAKRGVTDVLLRTPTQGQSPAAFNASLLQATGGAGFDDIVVLAPSAGVIAGAIGMLAHGAVMNVFAGLSRGVRAPIDLRVVVSKGVRFTGTSGSAISDLRTMLDLAESGQLDPNLSVAAIAGLNGAKKGIEGVVNQTFAGKVVVYPQILDFPLTPLEELSGVLPNVYAKLGPRQSWTVEAEAEFLKELLP